MRHNEYDIGAAFQAIEDELIKSMIRNMDRHRAEETKEGIEWSMWQTEQLKALEKYKKDNQKRYRKQFQDLNKEMGELIRISRQRGNMQQEIQILNAIRKGFPARKINKGATAEFFRLNDRKLEALIKATTNDMERAETAVLRMANDQYRKAIFNAQVYANSGAGTYEKPWIWPPGICSHGALTVWSMPMVPAIPYQIMPTWPSGRPASGRICKEKERSVKNGGLLP